MIALSTNQSSAQAFITVRKEVAKFMFLHLSVCPRGGVASVHAEIPLPRSRHHHLGAGTPREQAPPGADIPWEQTPLSRHPPEQASPQQTAIVADGMYPTGMHSCSQCYFVH